MTEQSDPPIQCAVWSQSPTRV